MLRRFPVTVLFLVFFLLMPTGSAFPADDRPLPPEKEFLDSVIQKIRQWEQNPPQPHYKEHRLTLDFSGDQVKSRLNEIYQVTWYRNRPVYVQLEKNGKKHSAKNLKKEEKEKKNAIDKEIGAPNKKEKITIVALSPLLERYQYRILGRETLDGRSAIKIRFEPIQGKFSGNKIADRVLEKTSGVAWFDETQKELMKIEAEITSSVKIGWGILASINLLKLEYHRKDLANGKWFVDFLKVRVRVRVLFFTRYNRLVESQIMDVVFTE